MKAKTKDTTTPLSNKRPLSLDDMVADVLTPPGLSDIAKLIRDKHGVNVSNVDVMESLFRLMDSNLVQRHDIPFVDEKGENTVNEYGSSVKVGFALIKPDEYQPD